ncbi:MAG TPA: toll/interleukin-1 receptor domain-containing protein [Thermomicrobiales bacterium]|nr:toll/interleukin-1 receptor domain-containing protein [Thermomicrobiales bacterium]
MSDKAGDHIELFISHASEDKPTLVRPLAEKLRQWGVKVWYDEFSLTPGDSLSRSLDKGLSVAQFGLVVLSPEFLKKPWPEYELRGLTNIEMYRRSKVIIPIWHGVSPEQVMTFSPPLADKIAVVTDGKSVELIAEAVLRTIRPDLADRMSLLRAIRKPSPDAEILSVPPEEIAVLPAPRQFRSEGGIILRSMLVTAVLREQTGLAGSIDEFLIDLYRDIHPEAELPIWEGIAVAFAHVCHEYTLTTEQRTLVVRLLLTATLNEEEADKIAKLLPGDIAALTTMWGEKVAAIRRLEQVTCVVGKDGAVRLVLPDDAPGTLESDASTHD